MDALTFGGMTDVSPKEMNIELAEKQLIQETDAKENADNATMILLQNKG